VQIYLASRDLRIEELCRQVLETLQENDDVHLICGSPEQSGGPIDLYIWDLTAASALPPQFSFERQGQHIFLVRAEDLSNLRQRFPLGAFPVLVKPITVWSLRSFLEQAVVRYRAAADGRRELLQFLIEANLKLQEYDQQRTNFLARIVHDFRVPLTAISGYCELLLDGQLGMTQPEHVDVLQRMRHSIKRLSRMAEAMFELSIADRVDRTPNLRESDLSACLGQAMHEIGPLIEEKRIRLAVNTPGIPRNLRFDSAQMEQVFVNLLDNARKFTPRHGLIEIAGYLYFWDRRSRISRAISTAQEKRRTQVCTPNSYRIDIADSGPGVPRSEIENIFEEYTSSSTESDRSGGGLGLAICRLILARHHGRIWAEATENGTRFSFVLPLTNHDGRRPDPPPRIDISNRRTDGDQLRCG